MAKKLTLENLLIVARSIQLLANPNCFKIIECLKEGKKNATTLQKDTKINMALTCHNLQQLFHCGLLSKCRKNKFIYYRRNENNIAAINKFIQDYK